MQGEREGIVKVLFLIQGHTVAASRYRVLQYIPYLTSRGVEADGEPLSEDPEGESSILQRPLSL